MLPELRGVPATRLRLRYAYEDTAPAMRALESFGGAEIEHGYGEGGDGAVLEFTVPALQLTALEEFLREQTAGRLTPESIGDRILFFTTE